VSKIVNCNGFLRYTRPDVPFTMTEMTEVPGGTGGGPKLNLGPQRPQLKDAQLLDMTPLKMVRMSNFPFFAILFTTMSPFSSHTYCTSKKLNTALVFKPT